MAMYRNLLEERVAEVETISGKLTQEGESVAVVDALATVDEKGENWAISLVNRHPSDHVNCRIELGDKPLDGTYHAKVLTGDSLDSFNDVENPERVSPVLLRVEIEKGVLRLPPHSLMIVLVGS